MSTAIGSLLMDRLVDIGPVKMGIPGLISLAMFMNPLVEVVPRIRRDRSVGRLPLLPYSAMVSAGMVWSTYAWLTGATTVLVCNSCSVLLGIFYCWVYCSFCPPRADWLPYTRSAHFLAMALTFFWCSFLVAILKDSAPLLLGLTGNAFCVVMFGGPLAAAKTVIDEKSTQSLPFGFTLVVTVNGGIWMYYAVIFLHDFMVFTPNCLGFLLGCAQLSLFARFGIHRQGAFHAVTELSASKAEKPTLVGAE
eukprot:TRINITY_DN114923_c0_g1_i1.p1 TRINITY_DN114923_c0_g1~~TRINITY_DN114923_c0_g1_i1.p1  ORF type:complete len:257 (+),score=26.50 TRINITY_DN114923_c0_g1_i1:22-771(+)